MFTEFNQQQKPSSWNKKYLGFANAVRCLQLFMTLRHLITFILLGLALFTSGQNLKIGTYKSIMGFDNTIITIKAQNEFDYTNSTCTGGNAGSGIYTLKKNELTLKFRDPVSERIFLAPTINRDNTGTQTQRIGFIFYHIDDRNPIGFASARIYKNGTGVIYVVYSDSAGRAWLNVEQKDFPVSIEINCIGSTPQKIQLDTSGSYLIEVPITIDSIKQFRRDDIIKFEVIKIKKNWILIKSGGDKRPRKYIKSD